MAPFQAHPVSARLAVYPRRDLLASHAKRIESAGGMGGLPAADAAVLQKVMKLSIAERDQAAVVVRGPPTPLFDPHFLCI